MKRCVHDWRRLHAESLSDSKLAGQVRTMNEQKLRKIMDLMKGKIRFPQDLEGHTYFLREPDFEFNDDE